MSPAELYEADYYEWFVRNAELLRSGRANEADLEHIAEELEYMAGREKREVASRLSKLLIHLLKWHFQPEQRGRSWQMTIDVQREDIAELLDEMPSLRRAVADALPKIYRRSAKLAAAETGLPQKTFPDTCPFTLEAILDPDFLP